MTHCVVLYAHQYCTEPGKHMPIFSKHHDAPLRWDHILLSHAFNSVVLSYFILLNNTAITALLKRKNPTILSRRESNFEIFPESTMYEPNNHFVLSAQKHSNVNDQRQRNIWVPYVNLTELISVICKWSTRLLASTSIMKESASSTHAYLQGKPAPRSARQPYSEILFTRQWRSYFRSLCT